MKCRMCGFNEKLVDGLCISCNTKKFAPPQLTIPDWTRIRKAIEDAVMGTKLRPNDSIQDIWNESLSKWDTGLEMDCDLKIIAKN